MQFIAKLKKFIFIPPQRFQFLNSRGFYRLINDKKFVKKQFKTLTGYPLNLENPITYNEKIQWLKLNDRKPEYTIMVDKYAVRQYVAEKIGEEYLVPLVGGPWNHFNEIDFDALPDQFVLKCTHDSGGVVICRDKTKLDIKSASKKIGKCLKRNYYWTGREWPYKNVPPRIVAEKYMEDETDKELKDYKIFCFDGEAKLIQVDFDRFKGHKRNLYTTDWTYVKAEIKYETNPEIEISRPEVLDEMLEIAHKLSEGIPHVRVDLYNVNGMIYFGELTFYHGSGTEKFIPQEFGFTMGNWLRLP